MLCAQCQQRILTSVTITENPYFTCFASTLITHCMRITELNPYSKLNMRRRTKSKKHDYDKAVRINLTIHPSLHSEMGTLLRKFKFAGPSEYIQARMRKDLGLDLAA